MSSTRYNFTVFNSLQSTSPSPSLALSLSLSVSLPLCLSLRPPVRRSVCLSTGLSIWLGLSTRLHYSQSTVV